MTDTSRFDNYRATLQLGANGLYDERTVLGRESRYVVYYTPFEFENPDAELVIVGLTPGPEQLAASYAAAPDLLARKLSSVQMLQHLKQYGAFGGKIRPNLCKMLHHFKIAERLGLSEANDLWGRGWSRFYPTSVVPNAAFVVTPDGRRKPFAGSFDEIVGSKLLNSEFEQQFLPKLSRINSNARFIALGPTPRAALDHAIRASIINRDQLLGSFAHPSTAAHPQVEVYLQKKRPEELHPKSPVIQRIARLSADFLEMTANVELWRRLARP